MLWGNSRAGRRWPNRRLVPVGLRWNSRRPPVSPGASKSVLRPTGRSRSLAQASGQTAFPVGPLQLSVHPSVPLHRRESPGPPGGFCRSHRRRSPSETHGCPPTNPDASQPRRKDERGGRSGRHRTALLSPYGPKTGQAISLIPRIEGPVGQGRRRLHVVDVNPGVNPWNQSAPTPGLPELQVWPTRRDFTCRIGKLKLQPRTAAPNAAASSFPGKTHLDRTWTARSAVCTCPQMRTPTEYRPRRKTASGPTPDGTRELIAGQARYREIGEAIAREDLSEEQANERFGISRSTYYRIKRGWSVCE